MREWETISFVFPLRFRGGSRAVSEPNPPPQRIMRYGTTLDWSLDFIGAIAAVAAGVTLYVVPLVVWDMGLCVSNFVPSLL